MFLLNAFTFCSCLATMAMSSALAARLQLCAESPAHLTAVTSVGSAATFVTCVTMDSPGQPCEEFTVHFDEHLLNASNANKYSLLKGQRSLKAYDVMLIVRHVTAEDLGRHDVIFMDDKSQVALNMSLDISEKEGIRLEEVLPVCLSVAAATVLIIAIIYIKKSGKRCQTYSFTKETSYLSNILSNMRRFGQSRTEQNRTSEDNNYATVDEVNNDPAIDDERLRYEDIDQVIHTNVMTLTSSANAVLEPPVASSENKCEPLDSSAGGYITPLDVVRVPDAIPKMETSKHLSLQRSLPSDPFRLECYDIDESPISTSSEDVANDAGGGNNEEGEYWHYCNLRMPTKTTSTFPRRHHSNAQDHFRRKAIYSKCGYQQYFKGKPASGKIRTKHDYGKTQMKAAETESEKPSFKAKCPKYVNVKEELEKYWESFRNVNKFMDRKRTPKKRIDAGADIAPPRVCKSIS